MTRHGHMRAKSRGFSKALIDLITGHGTWEGERQVLNRRDLRAGLEAIDALRSQVIRLSDKGGGTAVFAEDGSLITVFSPRTHRRPRRSRRASMAEA